MLVSLSSIATFYFSFSEVNFTLTDGNVNVDSVSTRAYISQCKGKQLLNLQTLMLMSNQGLVQLSLMLTLMSIKSKVEFYVSLSDKHCHINGRGVNAGVAFNPCIYIKVQGKTKSEYGIVNVNVKYYLVYYIFYIKGIIKY